MAEFLVGGVNKIDLTEQFKSEIPQVKIKFPVDFGEEHPFDFKQCENTYCKFCLTKAAVDKHLDFIISPGFYVTSEDTKAETIINQFIIENSFEQTLRDWIQEGLIKGS